LILCPKIYRRGETGPNIVCNTFYFVLLELLFSSHNQKSVGLGHLILF